MQKTKITLSILFCCICHLVAQQSETDSLLKILPSLKEDTNKVLTYWDLGAAVIYQDPQSALPYFKKGEQLARILKFDRGIEKCNAAIGLSYSFLAKFQDAIAYFDTAVVYAIKVGDNNRLALAYLNRADLNTNLDNFQTALKDCKTALVFAEKADNKDKLGRIYDVTCTIYEALGQKEKAIEYMYKALSLYKEVGNRQMEGMAYFTLATIDQNLGSGNDVEEYILKAIAIAKEVDDVMNMSSYTNVLAQHYTIQKDYDNAIKTAKEALSYAEMVGNDVQRSVILILFSNIYKLQELPLKALPPALEAYEILQNENDAGRISTAASLISELYHQMGDESNAYKYLKINYELSDSLNKQQFTAENAKLQTAFDVAQKEKEIALLNKENELQQAKISRQTILNLVYLIIGLFAILAVWQILIRLRISKEIDELKLRNEIAADLHDEVGSSLSSIHMLSKMAEKKQDNDHFQQELVKKMSIQTKETMDRMSDIVWMVKPVDMESSGLKVKLEDYIKEISTNSGIEISYNIDQLDGIKLSMNQKKNIYLILKEAINNAAKYAHSDHMSLQVKKSDHFLEFDFEDYGQGFDVEEKPGGNGLENMRNRAQDIGADFDLQSNNTSGTQIRIKLPI